MSSNAELLSFLANTATNSVLLGNATFPGSGNIVLSDTTGTIRAVIDNSGNLAVGYTVAQNGAKLSVSGGISVSGTITATNFVGSFSGTVTGTASSANNLAGGTAGQLVYQSSVGATSFTGPGTAGQILLSAGTSAPVYTNTSSIYVGAATSSVNLFGGVAGQISYQSGTGTTAFSSNLTYTAGSFTFYAPFGTMASFTKLGTSINAPAWTTISPAFDSAPALLTDNSSAPGATISFRTGNGIRSPNFAATNAITITDASTLYVNGPVASTNVTITNSYGIYNTSNEYIGGSLVVAGANSYILGTTSVSSTLTGALQVRGGLGVGGGGYFGGTVTATNFIGNLTGTVTGTSTQIQTIAQPANASYYPTFVSANNASATGMSVYTTSSFVINPATGTIGIGTNSPSQKLTIAGGSIQIDNAQYIYDKTSASTSTRILGINVANDLYFGSVDAVIGNIFIQNNGSTKVTIDPSGNLGLGFTPTVYGDTPKLLIYGGASSSAPSIEVSQNGTGVAYHWQMRNGNGIVGWMGSDNTSFVFGTGSSTERMRLDSSGNLGIGITNPSYQLHVVGSGTTQNYTKTTGTGSYASVSAASDKNESVFRSYGSTFSTFTHAGVSLANWTELWGGTLSSTGPAGMLIGIDSAAPIVLATNNTERVRIDSSGNVTPGTNATQDLGSSTLAWRNLYTNDLHLSNMGHEEGNSVDGTKGSWTVQEGEEDLYLINNRTGKKYRFKLEEIE